MVQLAQRSPPPLPEGIVIRTPSPAQPNCLPGPMARVESLPSPLAPNVSSSFFSGRREYLENDPEFLFSMANFGPLPGETLNEFSSWVLSLCLETTPFRSFLHRTSREFA